MNNNLSFKDKNTEVSTEFNENYGVATSISVNQVEKFATLADFAEGVSAEFATPLIPGWIYENLPDIIKDGVSVFSDPGQKDIFLTGTIGVLSGCIPRFFGVYAGSKCFANLYTFVTAPAASGKGALNYSKVYGNYYHDSLITKTEVGKAKKLLYIPANSSSAALVSHLSENGGNGIFFETEADTLSATFKNEWGNFSDLLRKAFHHEGVSYSRKTNNEYISFSLPKLAVVLSGTPHQVKSLINSTENGLFSRFMFYAFQSPSIWNDVSPNGSNITPEYFECIETRAGEIISKLNQVESIEFKLSAKQWDILNETQAQDQKTAIEDYGDNVSSVTRRTGLMWFRIAMILSAFRSYDTIEKSGEIVCSDLDFELAKHLMKTYKTHILSVYSTLPQQTVPAVNNLMIEFYESLPNKFKRHEAIKTGKILDIGVRNIDKYLQQLFKQGKLKKSGQLGQYSKAI